MNLTKLASLSCLAFLILGPITLACSSHETKVVRERAPERVVVHEHDHH